MIGYHSFDGIIFQDPVTRRAVTGATASVFDAMTGDPVDVYTKTAEPVVTTLRTNIDGYTGEFYLPDTVLVAEIHAGGMAKTRVAKEIEAQRADELIQSRSNVALDSDGTYYIRPGANDAKIITDPDGTYYLEAT